MSPRRNRCIKLDAHKHMPWRAHAFLATAYAAVTKKDARAPRM